MNLVHRSSLSLFRGLFSAVAIGVTLVLLGAGPARAQEEDLGIPLELLEEVMPLATSFTPREGDPPVFRGHSVGPSTGERTLVGYVFLTSDLPPEELGYSGPIEALVGVDLDGVLTGVRVTDYRESYIRTRGDFLRTRGYEDQFTGKSIGDPFRAKRDVRVVSRATISVAAMSRGIRAAARRVYGSYLATAPSVESGGSLLTIDIAELEALSWPEIVGGDLAHQIHVLNNEVVRIELSFALVRSDSVGAALLGSQEFGEVLTAAGERAAEDHLMLVGVDGALALLFYPRTLSIIQGADTLKVGDEDVFMLGEPTGGKVRGQFRNHGVVAMNSSVDLARPFTIMFDLRPGMDFYTTEYPPPATVMAAAPAPPPVRQPEPTAADPPQAVDEPPPTAVDATPAPEAFPSAVEGSDPAAAGDETVRAVESATATASEPVTDAADAPPEGSPVSQPTSEGSPASEPTSEVTPTGEASSPSTTREAGSSELPGSAGTVVEGAASGPAAGIDAAGPADAGTPAVEGALPSTAAAAGAQPSAGVPIDFSLVEEQTVLGRTLERTTVAEVAWMLALLGLVTAAFFLKNARLRPVALVATFAYLGWIDGGFLSVSHITSTISVGPGVFLEDIPLLILVTFTVLTTLFWGRVFCGFLCPFGTIQDFLEKVVPQRFQRTMPRALHERALKLKYVILAIILLPALAGSSMSIFPFFEPFGTVFFLSSSVALWVIAGGVLVASAIVPRFYCRYACPLGAALAVASTISPFRIRRVEHCDYCKVCEQACPTGAIDGPAIDFKECVRCNICEIKLNEQAGVCRHDIGVVRQRLVQLNVAASVGGD